MRVFFSGLCALLLILTFHPTPVPADSITDGAPLDEYFGRLKLSPIGVRNELHRLEQRVDADPTHAEKIFGLADLVEDSLHDWQHKYPHDPWIPQRLRLLVEVYTHIHTSAGLLRAHHALAWLLSVTINGPDADRAILLVAHALGEALPTSSPNGSSITVKSMQFSDPTTPVASPEPIPTPRVRVRPSGKQYK